MSDTSIHICFVCLGNICRSPTAEGVMRKFVLDAGLGDQVQIDSAGTGAWHEGEGADPRSRSTAMARGYRLDGVARKFVVQDFDRFDYVIAMDRQNLMDLREQALHDMHSSKLRLLRSFDPGADDPEVPDPYYGGDGGFDRVLDICEAGCRGLLEHLRGTHAL